VASYADYCDTLISLCKHLEGFQGLASETYANIILMFVMEEHTVIAPASIARNLLLRICSLDDIWLIWKA
jgi:hypothetical protein